MSTLPQIIGIAGKAGAGKDTAAHYLHNFYVNVYIEHFADPLKDACAAAFGIPRFHFDQPEIKEIHNPYWNISPRQIAQFVGTELFRTEVGDLLKLPRTFWVERMQGKLSGKLLLPEEGDYEPGDTVVIPDVRFQDEYDWIVDNGGIVIILTRPGYDGKVGLKSHASEAGFQSTQLDYTYERTNDGTLENLFLKVVNAISLSHIQLIPKGNSYHERTS